MLLLLIYCEILRFGVECASLPPLMWLGTNEGLSMQMKNLEILWNAAVFHKRSIVVVPFFNKAHYPDVPYGNSISLCDLFVLPFDVECMPSTVDRLALVEAQGCKIRTPSTFKDNKWLFYPRAYNLKSFPGVSDTDPEKWLLNNAEFDWQTETCVIGSPRHFVGGEFLESNSYSSASKWSVKIQPWYENQYKAAIGAFMTAKDNTPIEHVVHWRRGDQLIRRCDSKTTQAAGSNNNKPEELAGITQPVTDRSVNCGSASEFIAQVRLDTVESVGFVYISTNEQTPSVLNKLGKAGFMMFKDIAIPWRIQHKRTNQRALIVNRVERFMIELQIMSNVDSTFHSYGNSTVHSFVNNLRGKF